MNKPKENHKHVSMIRTETHNKEEGTCEQIIILSQLSVVVKPYVRNNEH